MLNKIIFKEINNYPGYLISNNGLIYSTYTNKFLKIYPHQKINGYLKVGLFKNNKRYTLKVHRLVAEAFIPNTYNLETVNHKDKNRFNNNFKNLEWMTRRENLRYSHLGKPLSEEHKKALRKPKSKRDYNG